MLTRHNHLSWQVSNDPSLALPQIKYWANVQAVLLDETVEYTIFGQRGGA
jgi:hypothetical protein